MIEDTSKLEAALTADLRCRGLSPNQHISLSGKVPELPEKFFPQAAWAQIQIRMRNDDSRT